MDVPTAIEPMAMAGATRSRVGSPVGFARPLKAALGGVFAFRLAASRYPGKRRTFAVISA